jgi:hydrophobic/amphiphilic exporter-1 (mainly G- bacteria), HAE1 family
MSVGPSPTSEHTTAASGRHRGGFNLVGWSIDHQWTVGAVYLALVLLSIIAIVTFMPRRLMPYVESPMIGIVTMQPGLPAEDVEQYISKPIEERMVDIRGVRFIRSTSQEGFSMVSLEFPYGTDMRRALIDVQALMAVVQGDLPRTGANLKPSWVLPIDPLNLPVLSMNLTGQGWEMARLRELADNEITNRLKRIPGVWSITTFGGHRRQLQVVVDRNRLAAFGLSILDVRNAVDQQNLSRPAGRLTQPQGEAILRMESLAQDPSQVANYPVKSVNGQIVYLKDVARVIDTVAEQRAAFHHLHNDKIDKGIEVSVIQEPQASSPRIIAGVMEEIRRLERDFPGIKFNVAYDNSHFVGILFENMLDELLLAVLLTGIVVLIFLGNWRGTVISMITIPVSMSLAILALIPMGMTLNSSTLIGLLLAIGRLVDDTVIDIHAIERHLQAGADIRDATITGITEVRLAVAASTLVLIVALVPLLVCGGIVEQMFVGLVWPIIFGLIASFLVSMTLTPVLAVNMLHAKNPNAVDRFFDKRVAPIVVAPASRWLDNLERGYANAVQWSLQHRFVGLARILITVIIGFTFYNFIGSEMMPLADVGQAYGVLEVQPGLSFKQTEQLATAVEQIMLKHPEIEHVASEIGFDPGGTYFNGYTMQSVNYATFMITLSDKDDRKKTIWNVIDAVQQEAMASIPGIRRLQIKEMGSDVMASSQAPISILITGTDLNILSKMGEQVASIARKVNGLHQVAVDWSMTKPSYRLRVDPRRAYELGLTPEDVAQQIYYATGEAFTDEYYRLPNIRQRQIVVRYEESQRQTPEQLLLATVTAPNGTVVPLRSVASIEYVNSPTLIAHDQLRRAITVLGFYRPTSPPSMDLSMDLVSKAMAGLNWPPGYTVEMRGDMTQMMDSFARLLIGLQISLILIFLILVAQFRGILQPFQMVFSLPLELAGVFAALWLAHQHFSSVSIMAVIILTGMDATTAILLIDEIIRQRNRGIPRDQAIVLAAPIRLRPILMTSLITVIVMLPVSVAPKTGIDAYSPLGTVIVGGLIIGTILSLFDIPIMHAYIDDLSKRLRRNKPTIEAEKGETPPP